MPKPIFRKNNLVIIIEESIKLLKQLDDSIEIIFVNNDDVVHLDSDKEQLGRVFFNMIKNSIESIQQKAENISNFDKKITIELTQSDDQINVLIIDNGIGFGMLEKKNIKNILNPYYTTKKMELV